MTSNMNLKGKLVRIILGIAAIGAGIYFRSWWGAFGLLPLLGAFFGWCPLCSLPGKSSCCKTDESGEKKSEDKSQCCSHSH